MKKIIKGIFNVLAWIVLVFSMIMTLLVFTADRNNGTASLFGFIPMTVESDSMKPTFLANDLIICREIDDIGDLEEGDVITYRGSEGQKYPSYRRDKRCERHSELCYTRR